MLANLLKDVRYSLYGFALRPMFAAVVVLTLALGIGDNVAVFSLYDRLMLQELNVENPHELVNLASPGPRARNQLCINQGTCDETFSYPMFRDLERAGEAYVDLAASWIALAAAYGPRAAPRSSILSLLCAAIEPRRNDWIPSRTKR